MPENSVGMRTRTFTLKQIIVGGFALGCAVAAATWTIRYDHLSEVKMRLEACEKSSSLNYPNLLTGIREASSSLQEHLATLKTVKMLQADKADLEKQIANHEKSKEELRREVAKLNSELVDKDKALKEILSTNISFSLNPGEGRQLAGGTVVVGFTEAKLDRACIIKINNRYEVETGFFAEVKSRGRKCKVILQKCKYGSLEPADFQFLCE